MEVRASILQYPDSPAPATFAHQLSMHRLMLDVRRWFQRVTLCDLNYDANQLPLVIKAPGPMRPGLGERTGSLGSGGKGGVANNTMSWWDAEGILRSQGFRTEQTLLVVAHHGIHTDGSGVAQPDYRTHRDVRWDQRADPHVGGLVTFGYRNVVEPLANDWEGSRHRIAVNIAAHEMGHGLGTHHTNRNPRGAYEMISSTMAYGHGFAAYGHGMSTSLLTPDQARELDPDGDGVVYFNSKGATPDEIAIWRAHDALTPLPDRGTDWVPGLLDDLVVAELNDINWALRRIDEATEPHRFSERRARLAWGGTTKEVGQR